MGRYILKRFMQMLIVLAVVSIASFAIIKLAPGDILMRYIKPEMTDEDIEVLREELGLNDSIPTQYFRWLNNILHGNMGYSVNNNRSVSLQIKEKLPATLWLMGMALLFSLAVSVPLGLISGLKKNRLVDTCISTTAYLGISIPSFWLALLLILIFSVRLKWFPGSGMRTLGVETFSDLLKHTVLPMVAASVGNIAVFTRYIRSSTITQMNEGYVLTALAKGCSKRRILWCHVLKNCLLPVITLIGMNLAGLVAGSYVIESIYGWPGLGTLGIQAVNGRDYPVVMGITMMTCAVLIVGVFVSDILYSMVDPRIKMGEKGE